MARRFRSMKRKKQAGTARERANRMILGRTFTLMVLCGIVLFIPLIATLYNLMIVEHEFYEEKAISNQTRSTTLTASRGVIYDRNMNILASSATVETIFVDPVALELQIKEEQQKLEKKDDTYNPYVSVDFIVTGISEILDLESDFVRKQATDTDYRYRVLKRKVSEETAQEEHRYPA